MRLGGNFIDTAAVGEGLLDAGFSQLRAQGDEFLQVLHFGNGLHVLDAVFDRSLGGFQVHFDQAFGVVQRNLRQAERTIDAGLVEFGKLLGSVIHSLVLSVRGAFQQNCTAFQNFDLRHCFGLLHCTIAILGIPESSVKDFFVHCTKKSSANR